MSHNIKRVELWLNECYGCDRKGKYDPLRRFILDNQIPLKAFEVKRIILSKEWTEQAESIGIEPPFVGIEDDKGVTYMSYDELLKQIHEQMEQPKEEPKPKTIKKKTASVKRKETKTVDIA